MIRTFRLITRRALAVAAIALLAVAIHATATPDASAGQSLQAKQRTNVVAAPNVELSPNVLKRQFKRFKAAGTNAQADMTPWEKFCFNIHGDDFTPDGYVACVNGWVE